MFSDHHPSAAHRAFSEAVACQDMLERVPVPPSLLTRIRARLAAIIHAMTRPTPTPAPEVSPVVPVELTP